jgi:hypothetical protein
MQSQIKMQLVTVGIYTITMWQVPNSVMANQPLPDSDIPEEVLRAEIITEARSPIDGKALSAKDFAELVVNTKQQLDRDDAIAATTNPKFKEAFLLLRLRGFLRSLGVPIK